MDLMLDTLRPLAEALQLRPWIVAVFIVVLAVVTIDFLRRLLMRRLHGFALKSDNLWDDALVTASQGPLALVVWAIGLSVAIELIPPQVEDALLSSTLINLARQLVILAAICWFLIALVKQTEKNVVLKANREEREVDEATVVALGRVVRVTVVVTGVLVGLDTMGFSISGLMAAGGIGGLAIGFAAKDILANFFGGITVLIDRPFRVGDWILLKGNGIEGTVEKIGWRQTTIRKFDKRPVYVPNALFTTASVENPSRMTHRRINEVFGVRKEDAHLVETLTVQVREMLSQHEEIDNSQTLMVNFDGISPTALEFFIYCMTHTTEWQHYHVVKQDVLLKINGIISRNGAQLAYPTQVIKHQDIPQVAGTGTPAND